MDVFKKKYHALKDENTQLILQMKDKAEELYFLFDKISSREMSIAKTELETSMMWATKAVVLNDEKENV